MQRDSLTFLRGVITMAAIILLIVAVVTLVDLTAVQYPLARLTAFDYTEAHFVADVTNRGLNQLLAVAFTVVAIAVPLTANLNSLKFLEFFIKDRVNAAVLTLVVFADLSSFWVIYSLKADFIPFAQLYLDLALLLVCLCLLFPYLQYVFRFLHPSNLLQRVEHEIATALRAAARGPDHLTSHRKLVAEDVDQIANIAVRSVERSDRDTAIESVLALERVTRAYWATKDSLSPAWFNADPNAFRGFSIQTVEEFSANRTWVEMKLFSQLRRILSAAVPRTHDVADVAAKALRHLGLEAPARADPAVRDLVVEFFNTFIRLALSRQDAHTAFSVFDHYRLYAEAMNAEYPQLVLEIAYYFEYYGQVARDSRLPFLVNAAAHDLGTLVQCAWLAQAPNRQKLLERFLHYDTEGGPPVAGIKKAQALLASYFMLAGQAEPAGLIRASFVGLDPAFIAGLRDDLLHIRRAAYWEVSERRTHIDYVPDAQREKLREFFEQIMSPDAHLSNDRSTP